MAKKKLRVGDVAVLNKPKLWSDGDAEELHGELCVVSELSSSNNKYVRVFHDGPVNPNGKTHALHYIQIQSRLMVIDHFTENEMRDLNLGALI